MTSSLVGSEMCIRDRSIVALGWILGRHQHFGCYRHSQIEWDESEVGGTVSYTHLTLPTICSV
eukprot:6560463-Prorocentrum_lima.AAC.1